MPVDAVSRSSRPSSEALIDSSPSTAEKQAEGWRSKAGEVLAIRGRERSTRDSATGARGRPTPACQDRAAGPDLPGTSAARSSLVKIDGTLARRRLHAGDLTPTPKRAMTSRPRADPPAQDRRRAWRPRRDLDPPRAARRLQPGRRGAARPARRRGYDADAAAGRSRDPPRRAAAGRRARRTTGPRPAPVTARPGVVARARRGWPLAARRGAGRPRARRLGPRRRCASRRRVDRGDPGPRRRPPSGRSAAILSYDYHLARRGREGRRALHDPGLQQEVRRHLRQLVRPNAASVKAKVQAEVMASGVSHADADRVNVLLFVNQTTTSTANSGQPQVALNRVQLSMVRRSAAPGWSTTSRRTERHRACRPEPDAGADPRCLTPPDRGSCCACVSAWPSPLGPLTAGGPVQPGSGRTADPAGSRTGGVAVAGCVSGCPWASIDLCVCPQMPRLPGG